MSARVWNILTEKPMPYFQLTIAGRTIESDADGNVFLSVPLEEQRTSYDVTTPLGSLLTPIIYMPCVDGMAILVQ
jgi:hypothetical protein